jgi:anti-sigma-K factor RskA
MELSNHPELVDRLAAAYALGTLRGRARRRFEAHARRSPTIRAAILLWQERLSGLTELQAEATPGPQVWTRIENLLAAQPRPAAPAPGPVAQGLERALRWWRGAAWAGALATLAAVGIGLKAMNDADADRAVLAQERQLGLQMARRNAELMAQLQAQPDIRYVSVLHDNQATPTLLAMYDPKHNTLTLKRVGSFQEGPDKSLQLWALPGAGAPQSLGVLGEGAVMRLPAAEPHLRQSPALAVSLEPKGGVPGEGGPTGPVIFKGAVLQTPL